MLLLARMDAAGNLSLWPAPQPGQWLTVAVPSPETTPEQLAALLASASPVWLRPKTELRTRRRAAFAMLPGAEYQPGRIIVIHGKAPGTPDTHDGSPVWEPARTFQTVDMRYWSLCNNNFALPIPVASCTADLTTSVENGDYTIVISDDLLRPDWLKANVNWLPWGDNQYPKLVFFRNMLSSPDFPYSVQKAIDRGCTFNFNLPYIPASDDTELAGRCVQGAMGEYYPVAAWCDRTTFLRGGWRACIKE